MAPAAGSKVRSDEENSAEKDSRLIPLAVAGVICFLVALTLGYGGWYLLGSHQKSRENISPVETTASQPKQAATPVLTQPTPQAEQLVRAPAGEIEIQGGELTSGGGETGLPLKREIVESFAIGETEVTNADYREFLQATNHAAPAQWENGEFPAGTATLPVVNITWVDANDYCRWLSEKIKAEVRLPTEAEWMLAAGGPDKLSYPWGNKWDNRAAASEETHGHLMAVRSYPAGKSPFGVYDMAGNVWEWTADQARDKDNQPLDEKGVALRVIKGGAADEKKDLLTVATRQTVVETASDPWLGFRYVVIRKK